MTNPLLVQFVQEAADLLAVVDDGLLRLEEDPADADLVNAVFRAAHTFKGSSGLFDLPELTRLTHAAEDLLDAVRSGALALDGASVDVLLEAFDAVRGWMPSIEATGTVPAGAAALGEELAQRLREPLGAPATTGGARPGALPGASQAAPELLPAWVGDLPDDQLRELAQWLEQTSSTVRAVDYRPDEGAFFRGEDPLALLAQLPALEALRVTAPQAWPPLDELDEYACVLRFTALTRAAPGEVAHVFRYVPDQVEVVEVGAPALRRLLDGESAGSPDGAGADTATTAPAVGVAPGGASAADERTAPLRDVLASIRRGLTTARGPAPEESPARLRAYAEAALRTGAVLGADVEAGQEAARAALAQEGTDALVAWVDEALAAVAPAPAVPVPGATVPAPRRSEDGERRAGDEGGGERRDRRADDPGTSSKVLKVDQAKVDRLLDLVGELVVAKNALPFVADEAEEAGQRVLARRVRDQYATVSRVSEELQQAVMDVRMLPVAAAFARVPRLVRDLSRKLGKHVRVVQEGEDTAADKDVIEVLAEPLVHLVRNSLDHGLETPEERAAAGKPEEATLVLRAVPDGDTVLVEVCDDGRGVDVAKVRQKAYERGVVSEEQLEHLSDAEAAELIFAPGFSTAAAVSDVSGRGVGMDAVRSAVEGLGGTVTVDSRPGEGMTVRLRLPLTMAVAPVLLVTAAGQRFGVPLDDVVETVRTTGAATSRVAGRPVLSLREEVVPLADLTGLLGLPSGAPPDPGADLNVLVVRTPTGPLGLVVDRFGQNTDVILKPLEGLLAGTPGFCGTALLGDGLVLLVLDVKELNRAAASR